MDRRAFLKTVAALPAASLVSSLARDALAAERAAPPPAFAHLHVHTRYSIVDSATRIEDLVARARELSLSALAITDHANLFGAVHFHDACIAAGVRPIIGCELYVARNEQADPMDRRHLTLLATNLEGYRNLCRLATAARAEPDRVRAVTHADLRERSAGLIARRRGITCGSTWGMAPGSLLAWSLEITQLDPLAHGLSFERFLNPERPSIPSIAIDVDRSGREELARLARERYGPDHVARVGLFVARRGRGAIEDAGCVLGLSENDVGRIRETYPERHWILIDEALAAAPLLRRALHRSDRLRETLRHARYLEGSVEWVATNAAELLVGDRALAEEIPLFVNDEGALSTQYDRDSLEKLGIASLVVIGSPDLSLVGAALARIRAEQGKEIDLDDLPLDDPDAYALLRKGECGHSRCGDTPRLRRVMIGVEPARFTDLMAVMALERRGADEWPIERGSTVSEIFVGRRRSGAVRYLHPSLEPILRETYGVILYQEQVNTIVREMTAARPGEADLVRRVFVRRRAAELDAARRRFVSGAERRGFSRRLVRHVFEQISTYGLYAFSKSAAASAALLHYRLAYLAAHHPRETEWARAQCESADMA